MDILQVVDSANWYLLHLLMETFYIYRRVMVVVLGNVSSESHKWHIGKLLCISGTERVAVVP